MFLLKGDERIMSNDKIKQYTIAIFIVAIFIQLNLLVKIQTIGNDTIKTYNEISSLESNVSESFLQNIVRPQMRRTLEGIREGWISYISSHQKTELLLKDNGNYIYGNKKGEKVVFDERNMTKKKNSNNEYDIYKKDGTLLISKARPQWNKKEIVNILNIIAAPVRCFGETGDCIVFDSYTGEVLLDNSENKTINQNGEKFIQFQTSHPSNKNKKACSETMKKYMLRNDSDTNSNMIYYFNEPEYMGNDGNNFTKYPLGQYNRDFQEKIILPYKTIGVEGQEMQLTIVLGANEQELYSGVKKQKRDFDIVKANIKTITHKEVLFPIISIAISLFVTIVAIFSIRLLIYKNKQ